LSFTSRPNVSESLQKRLPPLLIALFAALPQKMTFKLIVSWFRLPVTAAHTRPPIASHSLPATFCSFRPWTVMRPFIVLMIFPLSRAPVRSHFSSEHLHFRFPFLQCGYFLHRSKLQFIGNHLFLGSQMHQLKQAESSTCSFQDPCRTPSAFEPQKKSSQLGFRLPIPLPVLVPSTQEVRRSL